MEFDLQHPKSLRCLRAACDSRSVRHHSVRHHSVRHHSVRHHSVRHRAIQFRAVQFRAVQFQARPTCRTVSSLLEETLLEETPLEEALLEETSSLPGEVGLLEEAKDEPSASIVATTGIYAGSGRDRKPATRRSDVRRAEAREREFAGALGLAVLLVLAVLA